MRAAATFVLLLGLLAGGAQAQQGALTIDAASAELDEARGVSIYRGNVRLEQGALALSGDTLTISRKNNDNNHLVATVVGAPATLVQRATAQQPRVEANAEEMEYDTRQRILSMRGDARITRGEDRISAGSIVYDLQRQRVRAEGGEATGGRVRITIPAPDNSDLPGGGLEDLEGALGGGLGGVGRVGDLVDDQHGAADD